jgi:hypothetical protein
MPMPRRACCFQRIGGLVDGLALRHCTLLNLLEGADETPHRGGLLLLGGVGDALECALEPVEVRGHLLYRRRHLVFRGELCRDDEFGHAP